MGNKLPESDDALDDLAVRRLLTESQIGETPELLEDLRRLRSFRAAPAPEPSGDLAALLQGSVTPLPKRSPHRGIILSFALAGAMAVGVSGVAASDEVRLTCESLFNGFEQQQGLSARGTAEDTPAADPQPQDAPPAGAAAADGADVSLDGPGEPAPDTGTSATQGVAGPPVPDATAATTVPDAAWPVPGPAVSPGGAATPDAAVPPDGAAKPDAPVSPGASAPPGPGTGTATPVPAAPVPGLGKPVKTHVPPAVLEPQPWVWGPGRGRGIEIPVPQRPGPQEVQHAAGWYAGDDYDAAGGRGWEAGELSDPADREGPDGR